MDKESVRLQGQIAKLSAIVARLISVVEIETDGIKLTPTGTFKKRLTVLEPDSGTISDFKKGVNDIHKYISKNVSEHDNKILDVMGFHVDHLDDEISD